MGQGRGKITALIGCERSGVIRERLRAIGINAYSCDLETAEDGSEFHLQMDIFKALERLEALRLFIVHPECRFLSSSGLHWNKRGVLIDGVPREEKTKEAVEFVRRLLQWAADRASAGIMFALENPQGCIGTRLPDLDAQFVKQTVQPYDYGDDASKATVLRLLNLPKLTETKRVPGRKVKWNGRIVERWSNQCDSGQNKLGPSATRWMDRARTYPGIGDAMRDQWGALLLGLDLV